MNMLVKLPSHSFRNVQGIDGLLSQAQSRHLTDDEYDTYLRLLPTEAHRVNAARDLMRHEEMVVKRTVLEIMQLYPYQKHHIRAPEKCIRDVGYVSIYSTHAMLVNDTQWFKDKMLYWMRTMIQAFYFPAMGTENSSKNQYPDVSSEASQLPDHVASIYDCYTRLRLRYQQILQPESWELLDAPLQVALDVLSETN